MTTRHPDRFGRRPSPAQQIVVLVPLQRVRPNRTELCRWSPEAAARATLTSCMCHACRRRG
jgi:hypothetical protein